MCNARNHSDGCDCGFGGRRGARGRTNRSASVEPVIDVSQSARTSDPPVPIEAVALPGKEPCPVERSLFTTDGTRIDLRAETLDDDDLVLIHMGEGAIESATRAALQHFGSYRRLESDSGLFCVSVFGLTHGVTRADVFAALHHGKYGEARYGDIKHLVRVLPTSIVNANQTPEFVLIQRAHYDLVIDVAVEVGNDVDDANELPEPLLGQVRSQVSDVLVRLLPVFAPRKPREDD